MPACRHIEENALAAKRSAESYCLAPTRDQTLLKFQRPTLHFNPLFHLLNFGLKNAALLYLQVLFQVHASFIIFVFMHVVLNIVLFSETSTK